MRIRLFLYATLFCSLIKKPGVFIMKFTSRKKSVAISLLCRLVTEIVIGMHGVKC